jgi:iron complex outermembrane receptor protein
MTSLYPALARHGLTLGWALCLALPLNGVAEEAQELPKMTVEDEETAEASLYTVELDKQPLTTPDSAELLRSAPGANVNRNGPLTGLAQYRGMYGQRLNVLINGIHINPGGPNGMDPPLSYIPRNQLGSLQVIRGIAPVSSGTETLGGTIIAEARRGKFASTDKVALSSEVAGGGATVDSSYNVGALGSVATSSHKLDLYGSREKGGNIKYSSGKIGASRHERDNFGAGYGFRTGAHEFLFDVRRNETNPTGTPALPMDIMFINTSIVQGEYNSRIGQYKLHAQGFWTNVNHEMSNYELRNPPNSLMTRLNSTSSDGAGYRADVSLPLAAGTLMVGVDGQLDKNDATIVDPVNNPAFRVDNFNDVDRNVYGFFTEWNGALAKGWDLQLGARYNRVTSDAGEVFASAAVASPPNGAYILQTRFNNADRSKNDNNFDLVAKLSHAVNSQLTLLAEAGRKTRSPSYQERYLWLPLQATNGLADGHNYVGGIDLDAEKAYEVDVGVNWATGRFYVEPRAFYRYVDDYIQGVPATDPVVIAVSTANGDPAPLQFANVDAKLYGADAAWGVRLNNNWSLDGIVSYVRGERDDINDNLYRIAPLNGRATLTYRRSAWWTGLEVVAYAKQNKVSETNGEEKTDAYQLLNLRGGLDIGRGLSLSAGVENILDSTARDHLAGINRVTGSDVAVGERLPSPGRNYFATLEYRYD